MIKILGPGHAKSSNSSSLSSLSDAHWILAVGLHTFANSEQARLNLTHEQSAVLHPVLQPQLTMLSKTREEGQSGPLL